MGLTIGASACVPQMKYGMPESLIFDSVPVDADGDGFNADADCNDQDSAIHPEAPETPGDGIDSNCDNSDDT